MQQIINQAKLTNAQRARRGLTEVAGPVWRIANGEGLYTMRSPSFLIGAVAAFLIDAGRCAIVALDGSQKSCYSNQWPEFLARHKIRDFNQYLGENSLAIALSLDSVLCGDTDARVLVEAHAKKLQDDDLFQWLIVRNQQLGQGRFSIKAKAGNVAEALMQKHRKDRRDRLAKESLAK